MPTWSTALNRHYVETTMGQIHLGRGGEGPHLLMIHSTPRSHRQFHLLYPSLVDRFHVIAPDTPGFGQSCAFPKDASFEDLADNLVAVLDRLEIPRTHVYGFHTGNKIAAALAARHPGRVDRLVLSGQTHSLIADKAKRDAAIAKIVAKYFTGEADAETGHLRAWMSDFAIVTGIWLDPAVMAEARLDDRRLAQLERYASDYILARRTLVPIYHANFAFDFDAAIRGIQRPTLVMEFATPQEEVLGRQAARLAARIGKSSRSLAYENTNAHAHDIRPDEIAEEISSFLAA